MEIGKFDMSVNNQLGLDIFLKEISFHAVILDAIIFGHKRNVQEEIHHFINKQMAERNVKPLVRKCFEKNQLEEAFRYMAAGKHIGKVNRRYLPSIDDDDKSRK